MTDDGSDRRDQSDEQKPSFGGFSAEHDADTEGTSASRGRNRIAFVAGLILLAAIGLYFAFGGNSATREHPAAVRRHPASALLIAGREAMADGSFDVALESFRQAEAEGGELPIEVLFDCAQASLQLGEAAAAEQYLRTLLDRESDHIGANELLCGVLRTAGRNWELRPHAIALLQQDISMPGNLIAIGSDKSARDRGDEQDKELESFVEESARARDDVVARLGHARFLIEHNDGILALPVLKGIVFEVPNQLEAQARLGSLVLKYETPQAFLKWQQKLPEAALAHPETWMVFGRWAEEQEDARVAARCYWEALRRSPDHQVAVNRLARILVVLDRHSDAEAFAARASRLALLEQVIIQWNAHTSNLKLLAELTEALGRPWESLGWSAVAMNRHTEGELAWAEAHRERLRARIQPDTPFVVDSVNLAVQVDLSELPLPDWSVAPRATNIAESPSIGDADIKFANKASAAGISFSFFNGGDPERAYMFEFSGGGVAVLDYDGDGWPDLYLTQGCPWPVTRDQTLYTDRLYRNLGDGRFVDVTVAAGLRSNGYGQGASVGDIDNDGWPDLYVGNIGRNQLYHNNGDGTFTDITSTSGISGPEWTVSTLIADLNQDSWPELYDVNYLGGPDVFTEVCLLNGMPGQCAPTKFPGEKDKVYRNSGNGFFFDVSQVAGVDLPSGKGMGIVAADFDGSRRLSLFIANDMTANSLFVNQVAAAGGEVRFSDESLLSGVALSESGTAASCMGVAVGDVNADQRLDLFVTNFQDEPNNLYMQQSGLLFDDRIRQSRLHDPGFQMEGWGAQFLDGDLDGKPDLVVANGHLDNYQHSVGVNLMPTQFFRNIGNGRFSELPAEDLGAYFETLNLGRAIARLDWNRDGRPDFCVTHTHSPFALLANETPNAGHFIAVHLCGVESSRDAIGTQVTVQAGEQVWSQQLVAGDGFTASNQRQLIFGLGDATKIDEVKIQWPAGDDQTFDSVAVDSAMIFIEGQAAPVALDPS